MKYKVPVYVVAQASKVVGHIECDDYKSYIKELDNFMDSEPWEGISVNISNDFEVGDSDVDMTVVTEEKDLEYYRTTK